MRKPFNLPTISELALVHHNDMIRYAEEREELLAIIPTLDGLHKKLTIMKSEDLKRKIRECSEVLEKYKTEIRDEKLNQLGI